MLTWLKKILGMNASPKKINKSFDYLESFSDICKKLEHEGVSSSKYSVFNMARYQFGQFHDTLDNNNMKDALEKLSKFNHLLESLASDIKAHQQMTPAIATLLQELRNLSAKIVKDFIEQS